MEKYMKIKNTLIAISVSIISLQQASAGDIRDYMNDKVTAYQLATKLVENPDTIQYKLSEYQKETSVLLSEKEFSTVKITDRLISLDSEIAMAIRSYNRLQEHRNDTGGVLGGIAGGMAGFGLSLVAIGKITPAILKNAQNRTYVSLTEARNSLRDLLADKMTRPFKMISPDGYDLISHAGFKSKGEAYKWTAEMLEDLEFRYNNSTTNGFYSDEIVKSYERYLTSVNKVKSVDKIAAQINTATATGLTIGGAWAGGKAGHELDKKMNPPQYIYRTDINKNLVLDK
jgi:hypothetical protein